jgi:hypothetical protein
MDTPTTIFLLGDSILYNNPYVPPDKSVSDILKYKVKNYNKHNTIKLYCLAEDNATIYDIYNQISKIDISFNTETTVFYISVGGNDILKFYDVKNKNLNNIDAIFKVYTNLIKTIQTKFPFIQLRLLNIYYPLSEQYTKYWDAIKKWNTLIYNHYENIKRNQIRVLDISNIITVPSDFTQNIELSITGGEKLANRMLMHLIIN